MILPKGYTSLSRLLLVDEKDMRECDPEKSVQTCGEKTPKKSDLTEI